MCMFASRLMSQWKFGHERLSNDLSNSVKIRCPLLTKGYSLIAARPHLLNELHSTSARLPHRSGRIPRERIADLILCGRDVAAHFGTSATAAQALASDRLHVALPDRQAISLGERSAPVTLLAFDQQRFDAHETGMPVVVAGHRARRSRVGQG